MGRTGLQRGYWFSGETIRKLMEIQEEENFPSQTLALETIIAEAYELRKMLKQLVTTGQYPSEASIVSKALQQFLDALRKRDSLSKTETTQKPLNLEIVLEAVLGTELCERHIDFLRSVKQNEGEPLESVFKRFVESAGVQITREEFFERIKEGAKADPFKIKLPEHCHYRVVDPQTEKWFCDGKEINPAVCVARQERYAFMKQATNNPKIICRPKHLKRSRGTERKPSGVNIQSATSQVSQLIQQDPRPKFMQDRNLIHCALHNCNCKRSDLNPDECFECPNKMCLVHPKRMGF